MAVDAYPAQDIDRCQCLADPARLRLVSMVAETSNSSMRGDLAAGGSFTAVSMSTPASTARSPPQEPRRCLIRSP